MNQDIRLNMNLYCYAFKETAENLAMNCPYCDGVARPGSNSRVYYGLSKCQSLHDNSLSWNETGISIHGIRIANKIIRDYKLDIPQFDVSKQDSGE